MIQLPIAVGRCVYQCKQSLGPAGFRPRRSLLGADIDRWVIRYLTSLEYGSEFVFVIIPEEDVVMSQLKSLRFGRHAPSNCGERSLLLARSSKNLRDIGAECAPPQRGDVAVENNGAGCNCRSIREFDGFDAPRSAQSDSRGSGAKTKVNAQFLGDGLEHLRYGVQTASNQADALLLDGSDEHQRGRSLKWGRSAIRGVAAEELPQSPVGEKLARSRPQRAGREGFEQPGKPSGPCSKRKLSRRGFGRCDIGFGKRLVDRSTPFAESKISIRFPRTGELGDFGMGTLGACVQIELAAIHPGMTCQELRGIYFQIVRQPLTRPRQEFFKHPAHGEHRGPGVNASETRQGDNAHSPTDGFVGFDDRDVETRAGQVDCSGQTANSRPNDDGSQLAGSFTHDGRYKTIERKSWSSI